MWKRVSPQELAQCKAVAELCKEEYKRQVEAYVPPVYAKPGGGPAKSTKPATKSDKPPKAPTAYNLFTKDYHARLKTEKEANLAAAPGAALGFAETTKLVAKEWKELPGAKKRKFQRLADKEKEKHAVVVASWQAQQQLLEGGGGGGGGGAEGGGGGGGGAGGASGGGGAAAATTSTAAEGSSPPLPLLWDRPGVGQLVSPPPRGVRR
jgi:uncharacterized membrane protein YgcG